MRLSSGGLDRVGAVGAALLIVAVCTVLAGCSSAEPVSTPTPQGSTAYVPPHPSPTVTPSPTGSPSETAVVSIAGVDVDGKHASFAGLVTQVAEDGGRCEFDLTSATGAKVSATSVGAANGATTTCPLAQIPISQLSRGSWTVVLNYHSTQTDAVSAPVSLEVP